MAEKIAELINRRRHQLLVHSCIYYKMNDNIIDDHVFDKWSKELLQLQSDHLEISKRVALYDAFKDWDGSTGAFLPIDHPITVQKARYLLNIFKGDKHVKTTGQKKSSNKGGKQPTGKASSKTPKRKKATQQRSNSLF